MMQPITTWELMDNMGIFRFNHIEYGHVGECFEFEDQELAPLGDENQTKTWSKGVWYHEHKYLNKNRVVVNG